MSLFKIKIISFIILTSFLNSAYSFAILRTDQPITDTDTDTISIEQNKSVLDKEFDYYLLALSWSPAYCRFNPRNNVQCNGKQTYRFVIHGLWPNKIKQRSPIFCQTTKNKINKAIVDNVFPYMPSEKLINHEWRKHGSCSGLDPEMYFIYSIKLYQKIKFPEIFYQSNDHALTASDLRLALKQANPALEQHDSVRIVTKNQKRNSHKIFQEIRICYNKTLTAPINCPFPKLTQPNTLLDIIAPNKGKVKVITSQSIKPSLS
jgi:ribonuclease T2